MACAVETMLSTGDLHAGPGKRRRSLGLFSGSCSQRQRLCDSVGLLSLSGGSGPFGTYQAAVQAKSTVVRQCQGHRQYNEDRFVVCANILQDSAPFCTGSSPGSSRSEVVKARTDALQFVGVFDGHGGSAVAQHCSDNMVQHLQKNLRRAAGEGACAGALHLSNPSDSQKQAVLEAMRQSFQDCDESVPEEASAEGGSTAVCAIVGPTHIWVASCGDSRAVVVRNTGETVPLTDDHKPERPDEMERIKAAGGHVFWNGGHRVMGVLSMSRAIGDRYLKKYGVTPEPDTTCVPRTPGDDLLLIASDGLWGGLSNEEAGAMARACIARAEARGVGREAALRVATHVLIKAAMSAGSHDNITVAIVDLAPPCEEAGGQPHAEQQALLQRQDAMRQHVMLEAAQGVCDVAHGVSGSGSEEDGAGMEGGQVASTAVPAATDGMVELGAATGLGARTPAPLLVSPSMSSHQAPDGVAMLRSHAMPYPASAPISPCDLQQRDAWHVVGQSRSGGLDLMAASYTRCVSMPTTISSSPQLSLHQQRPLSHPAPQPPIIATAPTPVTTGACSASLPTLPASCGAPPCLSAPATPVHARLGQVGPSSSMPHLPQRMSRLSVAAPPVLDLSAERLMVAVEPCSPVALTHAQ